MEQGPIRFYAKERFFFLLLFNLIQGPQAFQRYTVKHSILFQVSFFCVADQLNK